jgi:chromosomal replication initiator protein
MIQFDIMETVETYTGVSIGEMKGRSRKKAIVTARYIAMYLMYKNSNLIYETIGNIFNRDHSTVIHACNEVDNWTFTDRKAKAMVAEIEKLVSDIDHKKRTESTPVYDINHSFKTA